MNKCPVCGSELRGEVASTLSGINLYKCKQCGDYFAPYDWSSSTKKGYDFSKLKSYFLYHNNLKRAFCGDEATYNLAIEKGIQDIFLLTPEIVDAWYPKTFAEQNDLLLLYLFTEHPKLGALILITEVHDAAFIDHNDSDCHEQANYIVDYMLKEEYLRKSKEPAFLIITPKGLARIEKFQKDETNNRNVFVAMSFRNETKETREAIRKGIQESGYSAKFMDETVHNHQIVPEMFRLIRECRFLIMDISDPNYGAYYEAGYAQGLGKEVIISCKRSVFNREYVTEEEKKYQRYLKPHFDIAQKQILCWENYENLTLQLKEWIKAIIG